MNYVSVKLLCWTPQSYDLSVHVYTYTKGRLTFLRYSASASLAGVSGCSVMRWSSQLRRRLCIVVLHSSVFNDVDLLRPVCA